MKCADCKFWVKNPHANDVSEGRQCRRRAPSPVNGRELLIAARATEDLDGPWPEDRLSWFHSLVQWPVTADIDFCGEFVAKASNPVGFV